MSKHTPGPWTVGYKDDQCVYAGGKHLATVQCDQKRNWAANARLIAAAPELETVASSFEIKGPDADGLLWLILTDPARGNRAAFNLGRNEGIASGAALGLENARRAAIAKATGGA